MAGVCTLTADKLKLDVQHAHYVGALSACESLTLVVSTHDTLSDMQQARGKAVQCTVTAGHALYFNMKLLGVKLVKKLSGGGYLYELTCQGALSLLKKVRHFALYNDLSSQAILQNILGAPAFDTQTDFALQDSGPSSEVLPRAVQSHQSDYQFVKTTAHRAGLSWVVDHSQKNSPVVFSDVIASVCTPRDIGFKREPSAQRDHDDVLDWTDASVHHHPNSVIVTGFDPAQADKAIVAAPPKMKDRGGFLAQSDARSQAEATRHQAWATEHHIAVAAQKQALVRALGFAGMAVNVTAPMWPSLNGTYALTQCTWSMCVDARAVGQAKLRQANWTLLNADIAYRDRAPSPKTHGLWVGARVLPQNVKDTDNTPLDALGHYRLAMPSYWKTIGRGNVVNVRANHAMHTMDHRGHAPVAVGSVVTLAHDQDNVLSPIMLGAVNTQHAPSKTTKDSAQNRVWTDDGLNRMAMINTGAFTPGQRTGRSTASVMESPNASPWGHGAYLRMGDTIDDDQKYSSGAIPKGLFKHTQGDHHEVHHGGRVSLSTQNGSAQAHHHQLVQAKGDTHVLEGAHVSDYHKKISTLGASHTWHHSGGMSDETLIAPLMTYVYGSHVSEYCWLNQASRYYTHHARYQYNTAERSVQAQNYQATYQGFTRSETHSGKHVLMQTHTSNTFKAKQVNITAATRSLSAGSMSFSHQVFKFNAQGSKVHTSVSQVKAKLHQAGGTKTVSTGLHVWKT
jgi:hypothetical protein